MNLKQKIGTVLGAISAGLGSIGAFIASFGLCMCIWAPITSIAGITSFVVAYLSEHNYFFIAVGIILIGVSTLCFKNKHKCKVHKK